MHKKITVGKTIGFLVAVVFAYYFWGLVFTPGTTGSNVVLGIAIAIMLMVSITKRIGRYVDVNYFHGGHKERAQVYSKAEQLILQAQEALKKVKRVKKDRHVLEDVKNKITELELMLKSAKQDWGKQGEHAQGHAKGIIKLSDNLDEAIKGLINTHKKAGAGGFKSLVFALVIALGIRVVIVEPYQIPSGSMLPTLLIGDHLYVSKLSFGLPNPFSVFFGPEYLINWKKPVAGEIVVFTAPPYVGGPHAGAAWVKRAIATEGQSVKIVDGFVYVDDKVYAHVTPEKLVKFDDYYAGMMPAWRLEEAYLTVENTNGIKHDIYLSPDDQRRIGEADWPVFGMRKLPGLTCSATKCTVEKGYVFVMGDNRGGSHDSRAWGGVPIQNFKGQSLFIWMSVDGSKNSVEWGNFVLPRFRWDRFFKAT